MATEPQFATLAVAQKSMPHGDRSKEMAFEMWKAGKRLSEIQDKSTAKPDTVRTWITEWERGSQGVWKLLMR
jgi:hypothetical protein